MNIVSKHLDRFIRWFKMVVLSIFFGKFPNLEYEYKIDVALRNAIDDKSNFVSIQFFECFFCILGFISAVTSVVFVAILYLLGEIKLSESSFVMIVILILAILVFAEFLRRDIRRTSVGVKVRFRLLLEVLDIIYVDKKHRLNGFHFCDTDIRRSLTAWLKEKRPSYEAGECREWEIVCSFMDVAWPRIAEDVRLYITSELSSVAISEWSYKLRVIRVNRRVSVKDLKKILTNKKGLVERPKDSTIFTGKAFSEHKEHQFFEFKDVSLDVPCVSLGSTTLNRLKFEKTEELETEGVLVFDKEDNSGFLEEESYVVFFTKR